MKITHKIMLGFFLVGFFIVITGIVGIMATNAIGEKVELVTQVTAPTVEAVDDLTIILVQNNKVIREYATEVNENKLESLRRSFDKLNDEFDESERSMRRLIEEESLIESLNLAAKRYDAFKDNAEKTIAAHKAELAESNEEEKLRYTEVKGALLKQLDDDTTEAIALLQEMAVEVSTLNKKADKESINAVKSTRALITLITIFGVCLAVAIGFFFTKLIVKPVNELAEAATKVSEGNFEVKVKETKSHDEIHHLTNTFNKMVGSLRNMLEESPRLKKFMQLSPSAERTSAKEEEYSLPLGSSYLIKEADSKKAFAIFLDKVTHHYQGICLSRTNPEILKKRYGLVKTPVLWLSDAKESNIFSSSDLLIIGKLITDFLAKSQKSIILLDRLDYLIAKHGFEEVLKFIIKINDRVMLTNAIFLVPVDPAFMKAKDFSFLEKEMSPFPGSLDKLELSQDIRSIIEFIETRKRMGGQVTFKDVGNKFSITAPTTQKRLQDLHHKGLIKVMKQGRNKLIDLTEKSFEILGKK